NPWPCRPRRGDRGGARRGRRPRPRPGRGARRRRDLRPRPARPPRTTPARPGCRRRWRRLRPRRSRPGCRGARVGAPAPAPGAWPGGERRRRSPPRRPRRRSPAARRPAGPAAPGAGARRRGRGSGCRSPTARARAGTLARAPLPGAGGLRAPTSTLSGNGDGQGARRRQPGHSLGPRAGPHRPLARRRQGGLPGSPARGAHPLGRLRAALPGPAHRARVRPGGHRSAGPGRAGGVPGRGLRGHRAPPPSRSRPPPRARPGRLAQARPGRAQDAPGRGGRPPRGARPRPQGLLSVLEAGRRRPGRGPLGHAQQPLPRRQPRRGGGRLRGDGPFPGPGLPPAPGRGAGGPGPGPRAPARPRRPGLAEEVEGRPRRGQHPAGERPLPRAVREPGLPAGAGGPLGAGRRPRRVTPAPGRRLMTPPVRRSRGRLPRLVASALMVATAATPASLATRPRAAGAATTTTAPPVNHMRLASQTPWVGPGSYELDLRLFVTTHERPNDVELAVTVYPRLRNRSEYARSLDDKIGRGPLRTISSTLDQLAPDSGGAFLVRIPVRAPAGPADSGRLNLSLPGVYPVQVELRQAGGGETLDRFTTHLLYTPPSPFSQPSAPGAPLQVAWVLPLSAPPALQPDGTRSPPAPAYDAAQELVRAIDGHPAVPLVLAPTPETIEGLAASPREGDRAAVTTLARDLGGRQVLDATYVPVSLKALGDAGLEGEGVAQEDLGRRTLSDTLRVRPDPRTLVVDGRLDEVNLTRLAE